LRNVFVWVKVVCLSSVLIYSLSQIIAMQEELRRLLSAKQFVAFTVVMSDGTHITVKHPETALLTKHWLYVTTDNGETTEHLYLLHLTRIQQHEPAS
jgi:hypothetical protein